MDSEQPLNQPVPEGFPDNETLVSGGLPQDEMIIENFPEQDTLSTTQHQDRATNAAPVLPVEEVLPGQSRRIEPEEIRNPGLRVKRLMRAAAQMLKEKTWNSNNERVRRTSRIVGYTIGGVAVFGAVGTLPWLVLASPAFAYALPKPEGEANPLDSENNSPSLSVVEPTAGGLGGQDVTGGGEPAQESDLTERTQAYNMNEPRSGGSIRTAFGPTYEQKGFPVRPNIPVTAPHDPQEAAPASIDLDAVPYKDRFGPTYAEQTLPSGVLPALEPANTEPAEQEQEEHKKTDWFPIVGDWIIYKNKLAGTAKKAKVKDILPRSPEQEAYDPRRVLILKDIGKVYLDDIAPLASEPANHKSLRDRLIRPSQSNPSPVEIPGTTASSGLIRRKKGALERIRGGYHRFRGHHYY